MSKLNNYSNTIQCLTIAGISLFTFAEFSKAAIVTVDPTDSHSVTTSHLGTDTIGITHVTGVGGSPDVAALFVSGGGRIGAVAPETSFSDGTISLTPTIHNLGSVDYVEIGVSFINGAGAGLNYARLDLDFDSVYETVVELDTKASTAYIEDAITRYAYDDTGAGLDIPSAVAAMNGVPEPSSATLIALGALGILGKRRRPVKK